MICKETLSRLTATEILEQAGLTLSSIQSSTGSILVTKIINKYEQENDRIKVASIALTEEPKSIIGTQNFMRGTVDVLHNGNIVTCNMFNDSGEIGYHLNGERYYCSHN